MEDYNQREIGVVGTLEDLKMGQRKGDHSRAIPSSLSYCVKSESCNMKMATSTSDEVFLSNDVLSIK